MKLVPLLFFLPARSGKERARLLPAETARDPPDTFFLAFLAYLRHPPDTFSLAFRAYLRHPPDNFFLAFRAHLRHPPDTFFLTFRAYLRRPSDTFFLAFRAYLLLSDGALPFFFFFACTWCPISSTPSGGRRKPDIYLWCSVESLCYTRTTAVRAPIIRKLIITRKKVSLRFSKN